MKHFIQITAHLSVSPALFSNHPYTAGMIRSVYDATDLQLWLSSPVCRA